MGDVQCRPDMVARSSSVELNFPISISQSLRSASVLNNGSQGIVSILLSSADLTMLDLSNLELFSVEKADLKGSLAPPTNAAPDRVGRFTEQELLPPQTTNFVSDQILDVNSVEESFHATLTAENGRDNSFSFPTPAFVNPDLDLCGTDVSIPVFKSKAVIEAEKVTVGLSMNTYSASADASDIPRVKKKAISMDELTFSLHRVQDLAQPPQGGTMKAQDDSGVVAGHSRLRTREPLPSLQINKPGLEEAAEILRKKHVERMLSRTLSKVTEEAMIDLKSSPAAKFLLQVMPWEVTPSPVTEAAVPFLWEDAPGKPKPRTNSLPSPLPALQLPPRLLSVPPHRVAHDLGSRPSHLMPFQENGASPTKPELPFGGHRKNSHSWHLLQNLFSGNRHPSQESEVSKSTENPLRIPTPSAPISRDEKRQTSDLESPVSILAKPDVSCSSTTSSNPSDPCAVDAFPRSEEKPVKDFQLPSPYVATISPRTSPFRDLGPNCNQPGKHESSSFVRKFPRKRRWLQWMKMRRRKDDVLHVAEPWAPTLATYYHRMEHSKDGTESSVSLLENVEGQGRNRGACDNGTMEKKPDVSLNSMIAVAMDAKGSTREEKAEPGKNIQPGEIPRPQFPAAKCLMTSEIEISEKREQTGEIPLPEHTCQTRIPHPTRPAGKMRRSKRNRSKWVFLKLRRSTRIFAAIYRALKHSILPSKLSHRKLLGDSKVQYQSLHQ